MTDLKFLDEYHGESLDEMLALEATHRIDSLVLAMESALDQKLSQFGVAALSSQERVILAIESLEREVNNGGYHQFFLNSSRVYATEIEAALRAIGCPGHAAIAKRAVKALKITGELTPDAIETALFDDSDELFEILDSLDNEYYACEEQEPIGDRLFAFAKANRDNIRLR